jgi:hypothetical protein
MDSYPPPEKCEANEPKPPRVTVLLPVPEDVPVAEWPDESLLKKLVRDDDPPDEPCPPPPDDDGCVAH